MGPNFFILTAASLKHTWACTTTTVWFSTAYQSVMITLIALLSQPATVCCKKTLNHKPEPSPQSPFLSIFQNPNTPKPQMYKLMLSAQTNTRLSVIKNQSSAHNKGPSPQGFITILECIFTFQLHKPSQSRVYAAGGFDKEQMNLKKHKKLFPPPTSHTEGKSQT